MEQWSVRAMRIAFYFGELPLSFFISPQTKTVSWVAYPIIIQEQTKEILRLFGYSLQMLYLLIEEAVHGENSCRQTSLVEKYLSQVVCA